MSNLKEKLIVGIVKDLKDIEEFEEGKALRRECSLLEKRIVSAKKLFSDDQDLANKLSVIEVRIQGLKGK